MKYIIAFLLCFNAFSDDGVYGPVAIGVEGASRVDYRSSAESARVQKRVKLYFSYYFNEESDDIQVRLAGYAATGTGYDGTWNTVIEDGNFTPNQEMYLRRLFVEVEKNRFKFQAGVIPPFKGDVSSMGLSKEGWITGARVVAPINEDGVIEMVVGELSKLEASEALHVPTELNYIEVEITQELFNDLVVEVGIESIDLDWFVKGSVSFDIKRFGKDLFEVAFDAIHKVGTQDFGLTAGISTDILGFFNDDFKDRIKFSAVYSYADSRLGIRSEISEDFVDTGHSAVFGLEGKIDNNGTVSWFVESQISNDNYRVNGGIEVKWGKKKR